MHILIVKLWCMDEKTTMIIIACLAVLALIIIIILIKNTKKSSIKKEVDDLYVRFNEIKTIPLAFKLNKAQSIAKKSEKTSSEIKDYYHQYENVEKQINDIQEVMNSLDDAMSSKDYTAAKEIIKNVTESISSTEAEVKEIDSYLQKFSNIETEQRNYSNKLKEEYRIIKNAINSNATTLSISFDALEEKVNECESLFSSSEEWIYANEFGEAQENLEKIDAILKDLRKCGEVIPSLIKDVKGVLPIMLDEVKREFALTRQRGVYLEHLDAENKILAIEKNINDDTRSLAQANIEGILENVTNGKDTLNDLLESFEKENRSFKEAKETNDKVLISVEDLEKVENYVRIAYDKDSARYGLENLQDTLKKQREKIELYKQSSKKLSEGLASDSVPSSKLLDEAIELLKLTEVDKKELYSYKTIIDNSNDGEVRALAQLTKLQLVVSEVEMKIDEYHLPSISPTYDEDLKKSRRYIANIKSLLKEIPINIDELNLTLDEAIDFVYKFYNNVNNVVGMALMVENAIVFGNKYRSTYSEIDRELSKAEFQFLNGEYTKALKTAITCMESLFPDNADQKIMENA